MMIGGAESLMNLNGHVPFNLVCRSKEAKQRKVWKIILWILNP